MTIIIEIGDRMSEFSVIIVSAGNSSRMNGVVKQLLILNNIPVIVRSIMKFNDIPKVNDIIVVVRKQDINLVSHYVEQNKLTKVKHIATGGDTRQESIYNGLKYCDSKTEYVAIHDGARPLVAINDIITLFDNTIQHKASILAVKAKETIKVVDEYNCIKKTLNRDCLYIAQTPQAFEKTMYISCINHSKINNMNYNDDGQLLEAMGHRVHITKGSYSNIKLTTQEDIEIAKNIIMKMGDN